MKASNGVEDKTKPTISSVFDRINFSQKLQLIAKGEVFVKRMRDEDFSLSAHKYLGRYIAPAISAFPPSMVVTEIAKT
jgi:hypothetical protein